MKHASSATPLRPVARADALPAGLLALLLAFLIPASAHADVILHAFNWRYTEIETNAEEIAARGYRAVLVSPPLRSEGAQWWARYQPQDYRVLDNPLGNREDLSRLATRLHAAGVALHVDLVLNHMANESGQRSDLDYPGARVLALYAANPQAVQSSRLFGDLTQNLFSAADFNEARCIGNYNDVFQVQNWRLCGGGGDRGLPDLAGSARVIGLQRDYLRALRQLGVDGFRIDAAKHMTLDHLNGVFAGDVRADAFVFGELITGGGVGNLEYQLFLQPYLVGTDHAAYDFPLFHAIRGAFAFGARLDALVDPLAAGQALPGARAVTFTVTHDIPNNQGFRGLLLDPVDETLAYAFVLGRNGGAPLLYSDHNESGDNRWVDAWRRADLTAMVGFHNANRAEDMQVLAAGACHLLFRRGQRGIVGINKCGEPIELSVNIAGSGLRPLRSYRELLAGGSITLDGSVQAFVLPARSARMWLRGK